MPTYNQLSVSQFEALRKYNITKEELELLREGCTEALELSYSPYSKFRYVKNSLFFKADEEYFLMEVLLTQTRILRCLKY